MKILVTGASGFVGRAICEYLVAGGHEVIGLSRANSAPLPPQVERIVVDDLSTLPTNDCQQPPLDSNSLTGIDAIVHCAARVHVMRDESHDPLQDYRKTNRNATLALARRAANAGVKRFVFLSTIKVNGEATRGAEAFSPEDTCKPSDPYALSKYEAENALFELARSVDMEAVVIRPPLVYGPGVKANFARLVKWVRSGIPLPLGAIDNRRSLLALENLANFVSLCVDQDRSPRAANQVFLIADGTDVSTSELMRKIARAYNRQARLVPAPVKIMSMLARATGRPALTDRLFGSLSVDISKAFRMLGWKPVITLDEQLRKMANLD